MNWLNSPVCVLGLVSLSRDASEQEGAEDLTAVLLAAIFPPHYRPSLLFVPFFSSYLSYFSLYSLHFNQFDVCLFFWTKYSPKKWKLSNIIPTISICSFAVSSFIVWALWKQEHFCNLFKVIIKKSKIHKKLRVLNECPQQWQQIDNPSLKGKIKPTFYCERFLLENITVLELLWCVYFSNMCFFLFY